eukprot:TRINITY_DN80032_c0_g1_i1.p1 TRINITY_DN80032_c0_g1~~TRINITY_DN80032_c0_g1_i1.p1  ORF type:complete len:211 (-),score=85.05 TRINITY_DN80032_c0_g1_i1:267-899(-)
MADVVATKAAPAVVKAKSPASKTAKPKAAKPKAVKSAGVKKVKASHPKYIEMVKEAIVALKERTGSSLYAISKFIEQKHPDLPANWKKTLTVQLRNLAKSGKLVKVKASFKLGNELKHDKAPKAKTLKKPAVKTVKKAVKPKADVKPVAKKPALKKKQITKAKSPKKALKPTVKKSPLKKPAAKKAVKAPVKKTTPKKPAVKKAKTAPKK